jgi:hypothetical protein
MFSVTEPPELAAATVSEKAAELTGVDPVGVNVVVNE